MCDSVLNIAPIGSMTIGERSFEDEENIQQFKDPDEKPELEIVTSSGRGKNGARVCFNIRLNRKFSQHSVFPVSKSIQFKFTFF